LCLFGTLHPLLDTFVDSWFLSTVVELRNFDSCFPKEVMLLGN
jgi:hypothetical protein